MLTLRTRVLLFGALAFAILLSVVFGSLAWSANYNYCVAHKGQHATGQHDQEGAAIVEVPIDNPSSVNLFVYCVGVFASENGAGITAVSTVFLTLITGILAWLAIIQTVNGRRQLRAYVFPEAGNLYDGTMITPPQPHNANKPGIVFSFKNTGQSPAKDVITWAEIDIIEPRHEATLVIPPLEKKFAMSLGAGVSFPKVRWLERQLNGQEIMDISNGTKRIYVFGRAEYVDIFGEPHYTNFRFYYQGVFPYAGGMNFSTSESGNDFN